MRNFSFTLVPKNEKERNNMHLGSKIADLLS